MRPLRPLLTAVSLAGFSAARGHPFSVGDLSSSNATSSTARVAIIGAGAGGSSAAFWIAKARERHGLDVEVDIYDREAYIGGRSTTVYPYGDSAYEPVELGASIFVDINRNLWRAADEFNLTRYYLDDDEGSMGLWDGETFLFQTGTRGGILGSWVDNIKTLLRYGFSSPTNAQKLVTAVADTFLGLYSSQPPRWSNITDLVDTFRWRDLVSQTGADYFVGRGISKRFTYELIDVATRVNYAQNVDRIHALEAACSLATSGAAGITGGNWRIFDKFVEVSGAKALLNTSVTSVIRTAPTQWTVRSDRGTADYRAVVLAAPYHTSGIALPPALAARIPAQPYVRLHVTLLTTSAPAASPAHFGLKPGAKVPSNIYTTPGVDGARGRGDALEFQSLSYLSRLARADGAPTGEWVVKLFSLAPLSDAWLAEVFAGRVGWVLRKEWDPYPVLPPAVAFPPVKLDRGLFYVNAFEPLISTMETETVAARNAVDLLLREEFGAGICGARQGQNVTDDGGFVYGWDC